MRERERERERECVHTLGFVIENMHQREGLTELGGGPSTVRETRFIPLSSTSPRLLFSSLSGPLFLGLILRNSTQSASTRFMCRSNARNVPINIRPSSRVMRMRCCKYWPSFPLPDCKSEGDIITNTYVYQLKGVIAIQKTLHTATRMQRSVTSLLLTSLGM